MARRYVHRSRASPLSPASSSIEPAIVVFAARCWASTSPIATSRKLLGGDTDTHARTTAAPIESRLRTDDIVAKWSHRAEFVRAPAILECPAPPFNQHPRAA